MSHHDFMRQAYAEAERGYAEGGVPIGCALVKDGAVVAVGRNRRVQNNSAIGHAEMDAFEATGRRPAAFYKDITLYTTLSPCPMCAGAIVLYGVPRVVVGENDSFMGEEAWLAQRGVTVEVLHDSDCRALMARFTRENRQLWHEDIGKA